MLSPQLYNEVKFVFIHMADLQITATMSQKCKKPFT